MSWMASFTMEKPLCPTRRETQATRGISGFTSRPTACWRAALQAALPLPMVFNVKLAARPDILAGSYSSVSMPLRMPSSLPLCWLMTPSSPWA